MVPPGYGPAPTPQELADEYDICVVGSGAAGSVVAWLLARAGLSVAVVEQGGFVTDEDSYDDVLAAGESAWVRQENGTWAKVGSPWTTCNVGGGTLFFGGVLFRHRPLDFDPETVLGRADLPLRWPLEPAELTDYYDAVEDLIGVAGVADGDPSLPVRSRPYPLPPVATTAEGRRLTEAARSMGWAPFPTPLGVNSIEYRGRPVCAADAPCISRRCPIHAKGDALDRFLRPAMAAGARLFTGLKAEALLGDARRDATALRCVRMPDGERVVLRARHFVLCANAVQTAALLLRSTTVRHPAGLGNSHDMVGRGLCFKIGEYLVGYCHEPTSAPARSRLMGLGPISTCCVTDLYQDPAAPGGLGGLLYENRPERTYRLRDTEHLLRIEALVPDEPQPGNRVRLGPGTDAHGVPDVLMDYQAHPRDLARSEYMLGQGEALLRAAGCDVIVREASGWALGSGHLHGTCRMGEDPATSVTGPDGRLHDADNVFVADGGLLPFPGGVNPTLTIQALALRVAHRLLAERYATGRVPIGELVGPSVTAANRSPR
ncbi:hypothetical protein CcI156_15050 [Frankia sp. CcI156]|uniref:Glucose-methanol-choline oxidoreductase n=1 Tax=Frankia casuarinae (strain DSM 45818 / CECT 9043 / HFP020203 / CcI3) TaxID=106370 RepID=Q2J7M7_FRACC|nr:MULTISPECIES: GMC family oxidoreductase [Frankia]ABD12715.1 glucose-methanol-choline oxidoreductase [Frankia casuarinae]ETA00477.1 choline dehydrogenase-like flavoprotein [Frankia sp. CcI6]EYT91006.1 choline dehydrogenase-like flavoprotein [Frankia casuarinae]OAA20291.1 choline dehydrogenase-like flavoprotein [Frankia casuarinae]OHV51233.1 hypothetical protein CgIS1_19155 [Frankia sp. CgIS1]